MKKQKVAILGASDKIERYSNKAQKQLLKAGHDVYLINPKLNNIQGHLCVADLDELEDIETLTVYVSPSISTKLTDKIINLRPKRVIFNPNSENEELSKKLTDNNIEVENACTLVLLSTDQF